MVRKKGKAELSETELQGLRIYQFTLENSMCGRQVSKFSLFFFFFCIIQVNIDPHYKVVEDKEEVFPIQSCSECIERITLINKQTKTSHDILNYLFRGLTLIL